MFKHLSIQSYYSTTQVALHFYNEIGAKIPQFEHQLNRADHECQKSLHGLEQLIFFVAGTLFEDINHFWRYILGGLRT